jgi:hypothetical protein
LKERKGKRKDEKEKKKNKKESFQQRMGSKEPASRVNPLPRRRIYQEWLIQAEDRRVEANYYSLNGNYSAQVQHLCHSLNCGHTPRPDTSIMLVFIIISSRSLSNKSSGRS